MGIGRAASGPATIMFALPAPGPVDQEGPSDAEQTDNFELGFKTTVGPRMRINGAVFFNIMKDMQRDVLIPGGPSGVVQDVAQYRRR